MEMPKKKSSRTKLKFAAIIEAMNEINAERAKQLAEQFQLIDEERRKQREAYIKEQQCEAPLAEAVGAFFMFLLVYGILSLIRGDVILP